MPGPARCCIRAASRPSSVNGAAPTRRRRPAAVRILKRDAHNAFTLAWSVEVDTDAMDVVRKQPPAPAKPIAIRVNGPSSQKVDLLILGDGYTKGDMKKFEATARRLADHLF